MILQTEMEALRAEPIPEGEMPASSVQVVSKVLSEHSSNQFLRSVGLKTPTSSKSGSSHESELREQLAAKATTAVQGELEDLRKKIQDAEEERSRTQRELEEYKKITEQNSKEMVETNLLIKKLLSLHGNASPST
jgi:molecular chaperone GrpE (heat shock protein)